MIVSRFFPYCFDVLMEAANAIATADWQPDMVTKI